MLEGCAVIRDDNEATEKVMSVPTGLKGERA